MDVASAPIIVKFACNGQQVLATLARLHNTLFAFNNYGEAGSVYMDIDGKTITILDYLVRPQAFSEYFASGNADVTIHCPSSQACGEHNKALLSAVNL
ncbi:hypothetical protein LPJ78_000758 [Coemansia sp. RSA 989]|nr:hypothetical protein LPJ78_000758 [Coemansia sp. RSA 989]KAJ1875696.1 hypothetical protein LPJ55_000508 [Coemansia sp. RSA 990]KAJ2628742.1 hypothetical protein H4R22_003717 [Coemansia sp. RSA 1290]